MDHIHRKQDGGSDEAKNLQITHPYCNSTIKN
jgi:5-methylcytosine-specific restriction endonuclease McrA